MNQETNAICASCRKNKFKLTLKRSRLDPQRSLLMCETCIKNKFEPRWIVMMTGREKGYEYVKDYVKPKRYVGDPILLEDML